MATGTLPFAAKTTLTTSALNSLASATYVSAGTIDVSAINPVEMVIEVNVTPGTVAGNFQALVFMQVSFDNTNFSTGPTSGTTATDEPNLFYLGALPLNSNSTLQRKAFSVVEALGYVPPYSKVIIKNDTGAAFAGSGHAVYYATQTASIA